MLRQKQAKKQLPKAEYEKFESVIMGQMGLLKAPALKRKANSARRLRDKHRDLARRQSAKAKKKLTNTTDVSPHLVKAEIYTAIADRIENHLPRAKHVGN